MEVQRDVKVVEMVSRGLAGVLILTAPTAMELDLVTVGFQLPGNQAVYREDPHRETLWNTSPSYHQEGPPRAPRPSQSDR